MGRVSRLRLHQCRGGNQRSGQPIRAVCRLHKQRLLDYLGQMAAACGMRDAQETARQLLLLIDGAIAMAQVSGDPASADTAGLMARRLHP